MKTLPVLIAILLSAATMQAQETTSVGEDRPNPPEAPPTTSPWQFTASLAGGTLPSSIALSGLPGVASCCPEYTSAAGWIAGLNAGVGYAVSSTVMLEGGLGFHAMQPSTSADEVVPMNAQLETVDGTIRHEITIDAVMLEIRAGLSAELAPGLRLMAAPSILVPLSATFTQTEELVEPQTVEFVNGSTTWNNAEGPLTADPVVSIGGGARYTFALSSTLSLGPEVWYHFALTDLVSGWTTNRLTLGIVLTAGL